jgi:CHAT domain-containing protein
VTLSACDTALGQEMAGGGIMGLTRAFMYAGTPSVVVSLWRVSDESTCLFMQTSYGHLKAGDTRDVALQKAMRELREVPEYSHPYFWAPFVLVGDCR